MVIWKKSCAAIEPSWRCFTGWCIPSFCEEKLIINELNENQDTRHFQNKWSQTHTLCIRSLDETRMSGRITKNEIDWGAEIIFFLNCSFYELILLRMENCDCFIFEDGWPGSVCMFLVYVEAQWHTWRVKWVTVPAHRPETVVLSHKARGSAAPPPALSNPASLQFRQHQWDKGARGEVGSGKGTTLSWASLQYAQFDDIWSDGETCNWTETSVTLSGFTWTEVDNIES